MGHARRVLPPAAMRFIGRSLDIRQTARRAYGVPWFGVQRRALRLQREHGWTLAESLHAGLLDPASDLDPDRLVAPCRLSEAQEALNAESIQAVGEHKTLFRMLTAAAGIASPQTYATFMRGASGWNWHTGSAIPAADWAAALEALPGEFILKPAEGYYGEAVRAPAEDRDGLGVGRGGRQRAPAQVVAAMREHPDFHDWIAQERLRNHEALCVLGGEALHTLRSPVTITRADGLPEVVWAVPHRRRAAVIDNYRGGTIGNLSCEVNGATVRSPRRSVPAPARRASPPSTSTPRPGYRSVASGFRCSRTRCASHWRRRRCSCRSGPWASTSASPPTAPGSWR
ncbi:MAG: sugar-transfer associated ATP-grasp domain-containing protein [Thermoleophilia bacterium]